MGNSISEKLSYYNITTIKQIIVTQRYLFFPRHNSRTYLRSTRKFKDLQIVFDYDVTDNRNDNLIIYIGGIKDITVIIKEIITILSYECSIEYKLLYLHKHNISCTIYEGEIKNGKKWGNGREVNVGMAFCNNEFVCNNDVSFSTFSYLKGYFNDILISNIMYNGPYLLFGKSLCCYNGNLNNSYPIGAGYISFKFNYFQFSAVQWSHDKNTIIAISCNHKEYNSIKSDKIIFTNKDDHVEMSGIFAFESKIYDGCYNLHTNIFTGKIKGIILKYHEHEVCIEGTCNGLNLDNMRYVNKITYYNSQVWEPKYQPTVKDSQKLKPPVLSHSKRQQMITPPPIQDPPSYQQATEGLPDYYD